MRVVWTKAALQQLETTQDHVAEDSPLAADRLALALTERTNRNPLIRRRSRARGTRELARADTSYIGGYRAMRDRVEILAIVHAAWDWRESLRQGQ